MQKLKISKGTSFIQPQIAGTRSFYAKHCQDSDTDNLSKSHRNREKQLEVESLSRGATELSYEWLLCLKKKVTMTM